MAAPTALHREHPTGTERQSLT